MFCRGWAGLHQGCTALSDRTHVAEPFFGAANPTLPFQSFTQRKSDCTGHSVAGQAREFPRELAGFIVLDVEFHHGTKNAAGNRRYPNVPAVCEQAWVRVLASSPSGATHP